MWTKTRFSKRLLVGAWALLLLGGIMWAVLLALRFSGLAEAAETGWKTPTLTHSPNDWTDPGKAIDGVNDTYALAASDSAHDHQGYANFSFGIPNGSIIDGIEVGVEAHSSDPTGCQIEATLSRDNGGSFMDAKTKNLTGSDAFYVLGSDTDDWGPPPWSPLDLSNANFVLRLRALDPSGAGCDDAAITYVDRVQMKVHYRTIASGTANPGVSAGACNKADFNFVIDMSGSIGAQPPYSSNLPALKAGINGFVDAFQEAGGDGRYSGTKFQQDSASTITSGFVSAATFKSAVDGLSGPSGRTPTAAGIDTALGNSAGDRADAPNIMFVVTDGSPNVPPAGGSLDDPPTWWEAANAAIDGTASLDGANDARSAGYVVLAIYVGEGDTGLPFTDAGDAAWAAAVMTQIGGGSYYPVSFSGLADTIMSALGCRTIRVAKITTGGGLSTTFAGTITNAPNTPTTSPWSINADGVNDYQDFVVPFNLSHVVTESTPPTGWALNGYSVQSGLVSCSLTMSYTGANTVAAGTSNATVCIKNTFAATGTLTVHKVLDSGSAPLTSFCFTLSPDPSKGQVCANASGDAVFTNVPAGTYSANETAKPANYHEVSKIGRAHV